MLDPRSPIALALAAIGAAFHVDPLVAGWALALDWTSRATTTLDAEQRAAVRRLALALGDGDLRAATAAARWITDPAGARAAALREQLEARALDEAAS